MAVFPTDLVELSRRIGSLLRAREETVGIAEGSAGGLVSATLLATPGASAYYVGGTVVYTAAAARAWMAGVVEPPAGMRGATEEFATYLAASVRIKLGTTWGLAEAGAAGPANPYGDPAGHSWIALDGPSTATRNLSTGVDSRPDNMVEFARTALLLFVETLEQS